MLQSRSKNQESELDASKSCLLSEKLLQTLERDYKANGATSGFIESKMLKMPPPGRRSEVAVLSKAGYPRERSKKRKERLESMRSDEGYSHASPREPSFIGMQGSDYCEPINK